MAGSGTRLLERNRDGVFAADLAACDAFRDAPAGAAGIGCPTLLVLGERDRLTPVRGGRALAGRMRDARIVVIPDCGHMMLAEKPDETLDALRTIF
jgi:pimeloyl-ACP methyl ester carboxylesterase